MSKFYGDINRVRCKYLLEATPYRIDPMVNFSNRLLEKEFYEHLFQKASTGANYKENGLFEKKISDAIKDIGNEYSKVEMIHIAGYGGCGKTTFVRHLLWEMQESNGTTYDVLDYEGSQTAADPILNKVSTRLYVLRESSFREFLMRSADEEIFNMNRFQFCVEQLKGIKQYLETNAALNEVEIKKYLKEQISEFEDTETFLEYLFVLDFFMLLYQGKENARNRPTIIVIDNVDSLSDLSEESKLISAMKNYVADCSFFFGQNINSTGKFVDIPASELIQNTKLILFLTTRIATIRKYEELYPDIENLYGWNSFLMPEHYYDHEAIIKRRIDYYSEQETDDSDTIKELVKIKELAEIAYSNYNFKRLFNGNIRFCIERLCDIAMQYGETKTLQNCFELYKMRNKIPEAVSGANGILLALILADFKNNRVFSDKLHLSECQQDNKVSLSRLILTILREKGNRCSMLELYGLLEPFFGIDEITSTTWALSENCREIWRRLLLFNVRFPKSCAELKMQEYAYRNKSVDANDYSEVEMCTSGNAYVEYVVPHFEFMLSRHDHNIELFINSRYQPLFTDDSEKQTMSSSQYKYKFERKINWVYEDVHDCCYNSVHFSNQICQHYEIEKSDYIQNTVYNYMAQASDGTVRFKQSYESRLIFSHIGYIERYRRYLLKRHEKDTLELRADLNKRTIGFIKLYLNLYNDPNTCYPTETQNKAARELLEAIRKIEDSNFMDFSTKIETKTTTA